MTLEWMPSIKTFRPSRPGYRTNPRRHRQAFGGAFGEQAHTISNGVNSMTQGIVGVGYVNDMSRQAQEEQALSEYQHGLAAQQLKRADETQEKALRVSGDLREILTTLNQAHERIASSVRMS
ncbi:hypothetical protein O0544_01930 [Edwardsiella anguillarum]|nr:hypothetical protein [Edwardsiella anguillarum]